MSCDPTREPSNEDLVNRQRSAGVETKAAVTLAEAVVALRRAAAAYEGSRYPQVAAAITDHVKTLSDVAHASLGQQLLVVGDACDDLEAMVRGG